MYINSLVHSTRTNAQPSISDVFIWNNKKKDHNEKVYSYFYTPNWSTELEDTVNKQMCSNFWRKSFEHLHGCGPIRFKLN